jgi:hypothetical protein
MCNDIWTKRVTRRPDYAEIKSVGVYKRGETYWFKFLFQGQLIRESARTDSKRIATEAERARRRELELGVNGLTRQERPLFPAAAKSWLTKKTNLTPLGARYYHQYITKLTKYFGNRLLSDITAEDVADLQNRRKGEGLSGRQINRGRHASSGPPLLWPLAVHFRPSYDASPTLGCWTRSEPRR